MGTKIQKLFQLLFISYKKNAKSGRNDDRSERKARLVMGSGTWVIAVIIPKHLSQ